MLLSNTELLFRKHFIEEVGFEIITSIHTCTYKGGNKEENMSTKGGSTTAEPGNSTITENANEGRGLGFKQKDHVKNRGCAFFGFSVCLSFQRTPRPPVKAPEVRLSTRRV